MKRIVCEQPDRLILQDVRMPSRKWGEALVRIRRIGICGTDLHAYRGRQPFFAYPRVLGHELSGEIVEVDENPSGLQVGDPVVIIPYMACGKCIACRKGKTNCCSRMSVLGVHEDGGMCEYLPVAANRLIASVQLTMEQLAVVEPFSIGAHAVRRAAVEAGEHVLVIGGGPIGLGVMRLAKLAGAKVIAMDINEERLTFCREWAGVDFTVHALDEPEKHMKAFTHGDCPDVVFDATGNTASMTGAFRYVSHGGRLVYVGLVNDDITFHDPDFHKKEMTLMASRNAIREDFEYVMRLIENGGIDPGGYITHRVPFDRVIEQIDAWLKPETGVIKAMVELQY